MMKNKKGESKSTLPFFKKKYILMKITITTMVGNRVPLIVVPPFFVRNIYVDILSSCLYCFDSSLVDVRVFRLGFFDNVVDSARVFSLDFFDNVVDSVSESYLYSVQSNLSSCPCSARSTL